MASRADTNARGAETRSRILNAAVHCLTAGGIDEVRIARVARIAGVSTALVHYHFDTRETLLAEALEASFQVAGEVRLSTKYGAGSAAERLRRKVAESLPFPGRRSAEWGLWVELWLRAVREPALRTTASELYRQLHRGMRDLIAEGVAEGEFAVADPDGVADRTLALIDGLGLRALLDDPSVPVQRAADEVWSALARELGLPPSAGAPSGDGGAGPAPDGPGSQS
jgi:AcrR family transcriptional regulator